MSLQEALDFLTSLPDALLYLFLFLSAFIEYLFPPAPGDTLVVAGLVLMKGLGAHFFPMFTAVTLGSVLGAYLDFKMGLWLIRSGRIQKLSENKQAALMKVQKEMQRRGAIYLAANRFLPGIRPFFFLAAGLSELKTSAVLFWSFLSALLWNLLLMGLAHFLSQNLALIEKVLKNYGLAVLALLILVFISVFFRRRKKKRASRERQGAKEKG